MYVYIYIYIEREREGDLDKALRPLHGQHAVPVYIHYISSMDSTNSILFHIIS